jgi:hypothetical protein
MTASTERAISFGPFRLLPNQCHRQPRQRLGHQSVRQWVLGAAHLADMGVHD